MVEFVQRQVPSYAILSHTWEDDEITFQEMTSLHPSLKQRKSWSKITATCALALQQNLEFVWIDTCCIDKSSSAELTESINSMFAWYRQAARCYVFLSDFLPGSEEHIEQHLPKCRWWTRGWTLQELIAPVELQFYDSGWVLVGTKRGLLRIVAEITKIPQDVLLNGTDSVLSKFSIAARMAWAAYRETTRPEDEAYCLLGLFNVNMPLIYGEGRKAFRRLQEEIVKSSDDLTILGCDSSSACGFTVEEAAASRYSLFALCSAQFRGCENVSQHAYRFQTDFTVTNRGLRFPGKLPLQVCRYREESRLSLTLGWQNLKKDPLRLILRKVGPRVFRREDNFSPLEASFGDYRRDLTVTNIYIMIDTPSEQAEQLTSFIDSRFTSISVPICADFALVQVTPESLWFDETREFIGKDVESRENIVIAMDFFVRSEALILVLCDNRGPFSERYRYARPSVVEYSRSHTAIQISDLLFQERCIEDSMSWTDLELLLPEVKELTNVARIRLNGKAFLVSAQFATHGSSRKATLLLELKEDTSRKRKA